MELCYTFFFFLRQGSYDLYIDFLLAHLLTCLLRDFIAFRRYGLVVFFLRCISLRRGAFTNVCLL